MQSRLDFFAAAALTGILSNPAYNSLEGQRWMEAKKLSQEKLAVMAAAQMVIEIENFEKNVRKEEALKSGLKVEVPEE